MLLPIYALGQPVLKKKAIDISPDYKDLDQLLTNMWDTMYNAKGVGLAAPQIGLSIRIFLVDTEQMMEEDKKNEGIKKTFINAEILEENGDFWDYEEGCLSIPKVTADISRQKQIKIRYLDENFTEHTEVIDGINARVIQHEYDHIEGILFTEKVKPLKKRFMKRKLEAIKKGNVHADYRLKFYL